MTGKRTGLWHRHTGARRVRVTLAVACFLGTLMGCATEVPETAEPPVSPAVQPTLTPSFLPVAPFRGEGAPASDPRETTPETALAFAAEPPAVPETLPAEAGDAVLAPEATEVPPTAIPEALERDVTYTVQAGDTLMGIALEFGVPMAAIQLVNDLGTETTVWVDQLLTLPQGENWANASPFWAVYEVMAGDTLSEIAARYDLGVGDLLTANGLSDGDLITVGQPLVLPIDGPVAAVAEAPSTVPEAPPPDTPATATPPTEVVASTEGVQAGPAGEPADLGTPAPAATATPVPPPEDGPVEPVSPPDTGDPNHLAALADEIFRRINDQRAAYGLPPLAWDDTLARAAQLHANDCYARGWCSHTGSDGSTYRERIIRAGYDPVRWSECWAWYATPEMAVAMWMDEVPPNDPHRRTILSDYLVEVGVGVVPGSSHGYYFIADFGTSRTP